MNPLTIARYYLNIILLVTSSFFKLEIYAFFI